eukprot:PhF_6_TR33579/c0_g1_i1/m.49000
MLVAWILIAFDVAIAFLLSPPTMKLFLQKISNVAYIIMVPGALVYANVRGSVSRGTLAYLIHCCAITSSLGALQVLPSRPIVVQTTLVMLGFALADLPYWKLQCLTALPGILIPMYNASFGLNGYPMLLIVEPEEGLSKEILVQSRLFWLIPVTLAAVRTFANAYYESEQKLRNAVSIATEVSELLAVYNTKGATASLSNYSNSVDCDRNLHSVLEVIVDNMKLYKPFLPNYVLPEEDSPDNVEERDERSNENVLNAAVVPNVPTVPQQTQTQQNVDIVPRASPPQRLLAMIPTRRTVSYAMIDFAVANDDVIENPQRLRNFVDNVYRYANATMGAVHSCVGDTVHMTWNTTRVIPIAEQCAVGAVRALSPFETRSQYGTTVSTNVSLLSSSSVAVRGSVMTGMGECRITGSVHQTFLLHIDWRNHQAALHRYVRTVDTTLVVCKATAQKITDVVMLVDVVEKDVEVYEVTTEAVRKAYGEALQRGLNEYKEKNYIQALREISYASDGANTPLNVPASVLALVEKIQLIQQNVIRI